LTGAGNRLKLERLAVAAGVLLACLLWARPAAAREAGTSPAAGAVFWDVIYYLSIVVLALFGVSISYIMHQLGKKAERIHAAREHEKLLQQGNNPGPVSESWTTGAAQPKFSAFKTVDSETGKVTYKMHPVAHSRTEVGTFAYILAVAGIAALFPVYGLPAGIAVLVLAPFAARSFSPSLERTVGLKLIVFSVVAAGFGALASLLSSVAPGLKPAQAQTDIPVYVPFALLGALVLSVVMHESAHGLVAYWCGDPTAKKAGRLTLNPLKHFDFFGSFILPALLFVVTNFNIALGYAKPVPINMSRFGHQRRDRIFTATAGAAANFMLAAVSLAILVFAAFVISVAWPGAEVSGFSEFLQAPVLKKVPVPYVWAGLVQILKSFFIINVVLGVLNLIPLPPLDGSFVLETLLPREMRFYFRLVRVFGFMIIAVVLALLMVTGVFGHLIGLVVKTSVLIRLVTHLS
jgi:Zn-dependent protease